MEEQIIKIRESYLNEITSANNLAELDKLFLALFGKNGEIVLLPKKFSKLTKEELKSIGPIFNQIKEELERAISEKREEVREKSYKLLEEESGDLGKEVEVKKRKGHVHPITRFEREIVELFAKLGFQLFEAPHIDTDYYNFEGLNIPKEHPARDLWDTLYIDPMGSYFRPGELLLRTHTSNSQIHIMRNSKPPIRMMNLGRCFRYENLGPKNNHTFEQFEIVYIDKSVNMGNLLWISEYFLKAIFGPDIKVRLKPKYYPFTEPSAGIDGLCIFCKGKGCKVCASTGWLELGGSGMIHPQVLKNGGIDPKIYSGLAWGLGPERMLMLKFGIDDVRMFNENNLKFLERF